MWFNNNQPSRLDVVGNAKYKAWCKFTNMSHEEAMLHYIQATHELFRNIKNNNNNKEMDNNEIHNDDIIYTKEDELNDDEQGIFDATSTSSNSSSSSSSSSSGSDDDDGSTRSKNDYYKANYSCDDKAEHGRKEGNNGSAKTCNDNASIKITQSCYKNDEGIGGMGMRPSTLKYNIENTLEASTSTKEYSDIIARPASLLVDEKEFKLDNGEDVQLQSHLRTIEHHSRLFLDAASHNDIYGLESAINNVGFTMIDETNEGNQNFIKFVNQSDDDSGQTALHLAADRGFVEAVDFLLRHGGNANACDGDGISVLQSAVAGGSVDVVRLLLNAGADPDCEDTDGDSPRSCAFAEGDEEMVEM
ncbi:MAG: acyl-CoA-binding protein, partial [bacterium]